MKTACTVEFSVVKCASLPPPSLWGKALGELSKTVADRVMQGGSLYTLQQNILKGAWGYLDAASRGDQLNTTLLSVRPATQDRTPGHD